MLLQFIVKNFMCFAEETVFSMVASTELESHKSHLIQLTPETDLLRISALYGANAHGKTKLVEAISFAQQLIVNGVQGTKSIPKALNQFQSNPFVWIKSCEHNQVTLNLLFFIKIFVIITDLSLTIDECLKNGYLSHLK